MTTTVLLIEEDDRDNVPLLDRLRPNVTAVIHLDQLLERFAKERGIGPYAVQVDEDGLTQQYVEELADALDPSSDVTVIRDT